MRGTASLNQQTAVPLAIVLLTVSTVLSIATPDACALPSGCALEFTASEGDRMNVPNSNGSLPDSVFTITAWIRTSSAAIQAIMSRGEDPVTDALTWGFGVVDAKLYLQIEDGPGTGDVYQAQRVVADGMWHHVGATRDTMGAVVIYVDGAEDTRFAATRIPAHSTRDLQIGYSMQTEGPPPQTPNLFFDGELDELTLWNIALEASRIQAIRELGLPTDTAGLLGYWRLDEGSGQIATDASGPPVLNAVLGDTTLVEGCDPFWQCPPIGTSVPVTVRSPGIPSIYPNPLIGDQLRVEMRLPEAESARVVVYDVNGRVVGGGLRTHVGTDQQTLDVQGLGGLPSGLYFVSVSGPAGSWMRRLVVTH